MKELPWQNSNNQYKGKSFIHSWNRILDTVLINMDMKYQPIKYLKNMHQPFGVSLCIGEVNYLS